ncbi:hypothetical protein QR98_0001890 [Sarcoptes scabiei]|uniref:Uncharacterized protein n=1 Tax=Sarcoptes scabiei TaxID=52283 RepID=A0A131ZTG7_SARSC|nr:hypothetical protein QR98_0001890 [Sarcoptes scabiei]
MKTLILILSFVLSVNGKSIGVYDLHNELHNTANFDHRIIKYYGFDSIGAPYGEIDGDKEIPIPIKSVPEPGAIIGSSLITSAEDGKPIITLQQRSESIAVPVEVKPSVQEHSIPVESVISNIGESKSQPPSTVDQVPVEIPIPASSVVSEPIKHDVVSETSDIKVESNPVTVAKETGAAVPKTSEEIVVPEVTREIVPTIVEKSVKSVDQLSVSEVTSTKDSSHAAQSPIEHVKSIPIPVDVPVVSEIVAQPIETSMINVDTAKEISINSQKTDFARSLKEPIETSIPSTSYLSDHPDTPASASEPAIGVQTKIESIVSVPVQPVVPVSVETVSAPESNVHVVPVEHSSSIAVHHEPQSVVVIDAQPVVHNEQQPSVVVESQPIVQSEPQPIVLSEAQPVIAVVPQPAAVVQSESRVILESQASVHNEPQSSVVIGPQPVVHSVEPQTSVVVEPVPIAQSESHSVVLVESQPIVQNQPQPSSVVESQPIVQSEPQPVVLTKEQPVIVVEPQTIVHNEPQSSVVVESQPVVGSELGPVALAEPQTVVLTEVQPVIAIEPIVHTEPQAVVAVEPRPIEQIVVATKPEVAEIKSSAPEPISVDAILPRASAPEIKSVEQPNNIIHQAEPVEIAPVAFVPAFQSAQRISENPSQEVPLPSY